MAARNLLHSIARLGTTLVNYGKTQIAQLGDGIGEEIHRATQIVIWSAVIVMTLGIGLLLAGLTIIIAFWDSPERLMVSILVTAGVFALAGIAVLVLRRRLKNRPSIVRGVAQTALLASVWRKLAR